MIAPFDTTGVSRGPDGIQRYDGLPPSLVHVAGCNSQLLVEAYLGGTTVIMPQFEVGAFLKAIENERIDVLTTVPAIYWLAINHPRFRATDVSSMRTLSYGGAPIAPELVARIIQEFPGARVGNGFGLTETSSVTTYLVWTQ